MKLSIIALSGAVLAFSDVVKGQTSCADTIDTAQGCLDVCVNVQSLGSSSSGTAYGNLLTECLDPFVNTSTLETCCNMEGTSCETSLTNASSCLSTDLADLQDAGADYLECIADKYADGECVFANFCVGLLTDGYGTDFDTNFAVGSQSKLADAARNAQTCEDPDLMKFGKDVCDNVSLCCLPCQDKLAKVVNAVMDDLLLPTYGTISDCGGNKTCANYTDLVQRSDRASGARSLAEMSVPGYVPGLYDELADKLSAECNDNMATEIYLYNETFAISNYFDCLYKKMGKIAAVTDEAKESSSISLSFGAMTVSSMIASVIYSIVA